MNKFKFLFFSIILSFIISSCATSKSNGCGYWSNTEYREPQLRKDTNIEKTTDFYKEEKSS